MQFKNVLPLTSIIALGGALFLSTSVFAAESKAMNPESEIHIDVPVKLKQAKAVFNMDHIALAGNIPFGMKYMDLMSTRLKKKNVDLSIISVFHGRAGYMTLNDQAYNAAQHVTTGNPYKNMIKKLIDEGVQLEECAVTMKAKHWGNKDLLPGIKVNSGAIGRLVQLSQEGYTQIQP